MSFLDYLGLGLGFREQNEPQKKKLSKNFSRSKLKAQSRITYCEPTDFAGIVRFVGLMRENKPVLVSFINLRENIERGLDFVCGAVCALKGEITKISDGIYFYAPPLIIEKLKTKGEL